MISGIDTTTAHSLRARGGRTVVLDEPGAPCRQCLEPGVVGDRMLLLTYQPFAGESPYAVPSPIFVHADGCTTFAAADTLPRVVLPGLRNVRSYDDAHELLDGEVIDGVDVGTAIERLFDDERTAYLHVYSATAGCFTCRVERAR
jgi:hypothetical protein